MTIIRTLALLGLLSLSLSAQAGFGIQLGSLSPTSALDDNDNSLVLGVDYGFKFALVGIKVEAFYVDSTGRYSSQLGDLGDSFSQADINIEGMLAADVMYYPLATTFFLQAGLNYTVLNAEDLANVDEEVIDNKLGLDLGAGITLFDKLLLQAKVIYTPAAINSGAAAILEMDENLVGFMVSAGWRF